MPREPYAKIGEKAERRVGRGCCCTTIPLPSFGFEEVTRTRYINSKGILESVSRGRKVKIRLGSLSLSEKREKEDLSWEGLRDEPMSEKHYALFMSSLSARSRELFFCGSIHFEERNDVCSLHYIVRKCRYS